MSWAFDIRSRHVSNEKQDFYREFGVKIANARAEAGVTQDALAEAVGLSRTSITNIEKGRQAVQLHLAVKIAGILGVELPVLMPALVLAKPATIRKLEKLQPEKRRWVERVIGTGSSLKEAKNGGEVQPSEKKGARVVTRR